MTFELNAEPPHLFKRGHMKYALILLFLMTSGCTSICTGGWTKADTVWELADQGLMAVDWRQTQHIVEQPDKYFERNPILGRHPSMEKLNVYFAVWVPLHYGISCALPPDWRRAWQVGTALVEVPVILENHAGGL